LANRFLWLCVRRSKLLPDGGDRLDLSDLQARLQGAIAHAQAVGQMSRSVECARLWRERYPDLSQEHPGLFGLITNRADAQVLRLRCIYALLDHSNTIAVERLRAALAVWGYVECSSRYIFGDSTGNADADKLLEALRAAGEVGLSLSEI